MKEYEKEHVHVQSIDGHLDWWRNELQQRMDEIKNGSFAVQSEYVRYAAKMEFIDQLSEYFHDDHDEVMVSMEQCINEHEEFLLEHCGWTKPAEVSEPPPAPSVTSPEEHSKSCDVLATQLEMPLNG